MRITIIGAGPRGMLALERIISWNNSDPQNEKIEIIILDPYGAGGRVWTIDQPYELIMNTAAQDITLFSDQSVDMKGPVNLGPNLAQWAINYATDYLKENNYSQSFLNEVKQITPNSYTSRALFGAYIKWFYAEQLKRTNENISVNLITEEVIDVIKTDSEFKIQFADKEIISDIVIASLGNLFNNPTKLESEFSDFANENKLIYVRPNFANEVNLDQITKNNTVAIKGLGLNFFDLMARLSYGRGGKFNLEDNGELTYIPSGNEPKIIAGSLHGLPNHSKGMKQKAPGEEYLPNFLNMPTLRRYKKGSLSYEEFWSMIKNEMSYVYYSHLIESSYSNQIDKEYFQLNFLQNPDEAVNSLDISPTELINWDTFVYPDDANKADNFDEYIQNYVKNDFQEAVKGTKTGPLTSALEVLRDIRANIRYVVENELLSKNDYVDKFLKQFNSINNLLSMGPPTSRLKELHALLKTGIIEIIPGEMAVKPDDSRFVVTSKLKNSAKYTADVLIEARIPKVSLNDTNSKLLNNLSKNNYLKNWEFKKEDGEIFSCGAVDFNRPTSQLIDADNNIVNNFYFWGVPTEGKNWLTTASPRPYINDLSIRIIDNIIGNIWKNK
ncbi:FAD-dependent oxidoreductase [Companilactobacillus sp. RD055328]|uniref:FAD/NAD(P)-binding protein n=1 Tax=Companilactobacillus sp. RD055328 TaxID=2916634 RepID=UPI001FC8D7AB|nr:FAD/NAD(P)-binding protein [Companilactobacillus sp. RD055328]GKQ43372.1 FAD-dependent oxidoreductase [Companilactobacillus sp. RD055328]